MIVIKKIFLIALMLFVFLMHGCVREGVSPQTSLVGESFEAATKTVHERLEEADKAGIKIKLSDFFSELESCLDAMSSPDASDETRTGAESLISEIVFRLDLDTDGKLLLDRIIQGYLGETNYYTTYSRMLEAVLGGKLESSDKEKIFSLALSCSYRVFRPLFEEAYDLLGDNAQAVLNGTISQILKQADGSELYFNTLYEVYLFNENTDILEKYNLTGEQTLEYFEQALNNTENSQDSVRILKNIQGVNQAWERLGDITDIFKKLNLDTLGLDTRGVYSEVQTDSDPEDLVSDAAAICFNIEYSNGEKLDNVFIIPKINRATSQAEQLNAEIYDYFISFNEFYEFIEQSVANYDWNGFNSYIRLSYDYAIGDDMILTITIYEDGGTVGGEEYSTSYVYKYNLETEEIVQ